MNTEGKDGFRFLVYVGLLSWLIVVGLGFSYQKKIHEVECLKDAVEVASKTGMMLKCEGFYGDLVFHNAQACRNFRDYMWQIDGSYNYRRVMVLLFPALIPDHYSDYFEPAPEPSHIVDWFDCREEQPWYRWENKPGSSKPYTAPTLSPSDKWPPIP